MKVGIDIGTSYSSIALLDENNKPQAVKIANGASVFGDSYSLPSAAFVEEDGRIVIGQLAVASRMKNPSRYVAEFKRDLGQQVPYNLGGLQLMPEDLYKEIFIHMKRCAEEITGEKISKAYITYPANFIKKKIELIKISARKSGLLNVEMIDEPTAAAYCYCAKGKIKENDKLLVYDFGGGTFDVALIEYVNDGFRPVTQALGIDKCGGVDIDRLIFEDIYNNIPTEAIEMINNSEMVRKRFNTQIMELSIKIKHHLSSTESFKDAIPVGFEYVDYELSREKMNKLISPIVEETLFKVNNIVKNAGLSMSDISTCLMVGGTSRIPYIREKLEQLNEKPVFKDIDPELAVCMGAALWEVEKKKEIANEEKYDLVKRLSEVIALRKENLKNEKHILHEKLSVILLSRIKNLENIYGNNEMNKNAREKESFNNDNIKEPLGHYRLACKFYYGNKGKKKDYKQAVYWFKKAAEQGHANSQYKLGFCYDRGHGVAKDARKAVHWYKTAADAGIVNAQNNLGYCYYMGQGVSKDYTKAVYWFKKAAKLGNPLSMASLIKCYRRGHGVIKDDTKENYWAKKLEKYKHKSKYYPKKQYNSKSQTDMSLWEIIKDFWK